MKRSNTSWYVP